MKYTPILRAKSGELSALAELSFESKKEITPVLQLVPDTATKRVKDYVSSQIAGFKKAWFFKGNQLFLDTSLYREEDIASTFPYFELLPKEGVYPIPVVLPNSPDAYVNFLKGRHTDNGICLRIKEEFSLPRLINMAVSYYSDMFELTLDKIDLIIDFGYIEGRSVEHYFNSFQRIYQGVTNISAFRKLVVTGGSFPVDVTEYEVDTVEKLNQEEWKLWLQIKKAYPNSSIIYGDYGTAHPIFDPYIKAYAGSCTIKYTGDGAYYVLRGRKADKHPDGAGQYITKSEQLVDMAIFSGPSFSWGDQYIAHCADGRDGPGNAEKWVKVSQNHHFSLMLTLL